jgi:formate/nitrite transporter FocA (FNT family)
VVPKKPSRQILQHEISEAVDALDKSASVLFISGLDIGFSLFLMAVVWTLTAGTLPEPTVRILVANMYAVGFIFVVLGRSELFTEQTALAVMPVLNGRATVMALTGLWAVVYAANLLGAAAFAGPRRRGPAGVRRAGLGKLSHVVVGSVEVLAGVFSGEGVSGGDYGRFLVWTTLGNAVGGSVFVALIKYSYASAGKPPA